MEHHHQKYCVIQRKAARYMVSKLFFRDNEKVLCIGCDYGKIKQKYSYLKFIDYVEVVEPCIRYKGLWGYDKVLLFFSWQLLKNPCQIFTDSSRLLKSEGRLCGIVPYYKSLYFDVYYQTRTHDAWKDRYNKKMEITLCGSKQVKTWLEKAGLTDIECRIVNKPFTFKTKEKFARWIMSSPEQFVGISEKYQQAFVNDIVSNYMECCSIAQDQPIKLHLPYMIVSGYKI